MKSSGGTREKSEERSAEAPVDLGNSSGGSIGEEGQWRKQCVLLCIMCRTHEYTAMKGKT